MYHREEKPVDGTIEWTGSRRDGDAVAGAFLSDGTTPILCAWTQEVIEDRAHLETALSRHELVIVGWSPSALPYAIGDDGRLLRVWVAETSDRYRWIGTNAAEADGYRARYDEEKAAGAERRRRELLWGLT